MAVRGGDKLVARIKEIGRAVAAPGDLRVGFLENALYPDGTPVAMVAAIHEYGAPRAGIPPRPYFRPMIAAKKDNWAKEIGPVLRDNNYDVRKTMSLLGEHIEGQLRESITNVFSPPLSETTLMLRKMFGNHPEDITYADVVEARERVEAGESTAGVSTKPLVWTGHLLGSIDSEVK